MTLIKKILEGEYHLEKIPTIIESARILLPVSAEIINTDKYNGDARSFGFPCDEGLCTAVEYNYHVGALVDDILSLIATKNNHRVAEKPDIRSHFYTLETSKMLGDKWFSDITKNDCRDDNGELLSFYNWPIETQNKYNKKNSEIQVEVEKKGEIVFKFEDRVTVYKYKNHYFGKMPFWYHGKLSFLECDNDYYSNDDEAFKALVESEKKYLSTLKTKFNLNKKINDNLELLKKAK